MGEISAALALRETVQTSCDAFLQITSASRQAKANT
jgi:hypothetical protein